ncbi:MULTISPECIES: hypothetical protein [Methylomonas]|uniref:hypothetical protein n=1 Tax=Methylomonas TaxID=416 RepID=UPI0012327CFE|nr:hypothetical protein [Methylomonas rhizoryzae]
MHDTGLTLQQAAEALGISRRMLIYFRDGEKPIPCAIWLACLGWEAVRPTGVNFAATYSFGQGIRGVARLSKSKKLGR